MFATVMVAGVGSVVGAGVGSAVGFGVGTGVLRLRSCATRAKYRSKYGETKSSSVDANRAKYRSKYGEKKSSSVDANRTNCAKKNKIRCLVDPPVISGPAVVTSPTVDASRAKNGDEDRETNNEERAKGTELTSS
jgi:hypothetical protein